MAEDKNISVPEPLETGASGSQVAASTAIEGELIEASSKATLGAHPLYDAVNELAESRHKFFGGEAGAVLMTASVRQITDELKATKDELKEERQKNDVLRENVSSLREQLATLQATVSEQRKTKHLKNVAIAIGTTLIYAAIELSKNGYVNYAVAAGFAGLALVLFGWVSPSREEK